MILGTAFGLFFGSVISYWISLKGRGFDWNFNHLTEWFIAILFGGYFILWIPIYIMNFIVFRARESKITNGVVLVPFTIGFVGSLLMAIHPVIVFVVIPVGLIAQSLYDKKCG